MYVCMYVFMYVRMYADCSVVLVPGAILYLAMSPAIWCRSVELQRGRVTGLTFPKYIYDVCFKVLCNLTNGVMHTSEAQF